MWIEMLVLLILGSDWFTTYILEFSKWYVSQVCEVCTKFMGIPILYVSKYNISLYAKK
jgi:hypothetical protein